MTDVTVRRWNEPNGTYQMLQLLKTDSLFYLLYRVLKNEPSDVYLWIARSPRKSEIVNFTSRIFAKSLLIHKREFYENAVRQFSLPGDENPQNTMINLAEALDILQRKNVLFNETFTKQSDFIIDPFNNPPVGSKNSSITQQHVTLDFTELVSDYIVDGEHVIINLIEKSYENEHSGLVSDKYYNKYDPIYMPSFELVLKESELEPPDRSREFFNDAKTHVKMFELKFPPNKETTLNLDDILNYFPMKNNIAAICYWGSKSTKNMRINRVFSGNIITQWISYHISSQKYEIAQFIKDDTKAFDSDHWISMYVEYTPQNSFFQVVVVPNGSVFIVHHSTMRVDSNVAGSMDVLVSKIKDIFKDLYIFSEAIYQLEPKSSNLFKSDIIQNPKLDMYHTFQFRNSQNDANVGKVIADRLANQKSKFLIVHTEETGGYSIIHCIYKKVDLESKKNAEYKFVSNLRKNTNAAKLLNTDSFKRLYNIEDQEAFVYFDKQKNTTRPYHPHFKYFTLRYLTSNETDQNVLLIIDNQDIFGRAEIMRFLKHLLFTIELDEHTAASTADTATATATDADTVADDATVDAATDTEKAAKHPDPNMAETAADQTPKETVTQRRRKKYLAHQITVGGQSATSVLTHPPASSETNISQLKQLDPKLFVWKVDTNRYRKSTTHKEQSEFTKQKNTARLVRDYATSCPYQAKGLTKTEFELMKKHNPSSFSYALKTGSDQKTCSQNYYICPRFWCPLSKVSISAENEGCPISGENPVPRIENNIHPYFLKPSSHQEGLLLPCCGVTDKRKKVKNMNDVYIAAHCRDTDEFQYHKMEAAKFKSIFEMFGSAKLKLYYLLESNIHEAFAAAFQLKQGAVDVILDNISPEDHLKINEGFNLRSFFDPGLRFIDSKEMFAEFIDQKKTNTFLKKYSLPESTDYYMKNENIDTDPTQILFMIFNSITNFKNYMKSDYTKIYTDLIAFAKSNWFNNTKTGILFIEFTHRDNNKSSKITVNLEKSAISPKFHNYCCFTAFDGYISPIFEMEAKDKFKLAIIPSDIATLVLKQVGKTDVNDFAKKMNLTSEIVKFVLDVNFQICGCLTRLDDTDFDVFVPFDEYFDVSAAKKNQSFAFNFSLMLDEKHIEKAIKLYRTLGVQFRIEKDGLYFPGSDFKYTTSTSQVGFQWSNSVKKPMNSCNMRIRDIQNIPNVLNDLYYLRHELNPMTFDEKIDRIKSYGISTDLATCMLRVHDIGSFVKHNEHVIDYGPSTTKKIEFDPKSSDFNEIMLSYKNPYLNMFKNNIEDVHKEFITIDIKLKRTN